ncbi:hypothetical protein, partial [Candidatus Villigracilis affinis]|uniref:hypothetical protein n=1 Tax=Candidatus Villigracilis affinis TaxID=3140682 RepID=UPI002A22BD5C|nr:hypothetical protein [Anaerolineales bacterium]
VESKFQELHGVVCWKVNWDANLNLSMNFGQPSLSIREPRKVKSSSKKMSDSFKYRSVALHGEWFFWILNGYWKVSIKDYDEVTGDTSYKRKTMALTRLDGQKLIHASVDPQTSTTRLDFDLGAILSIRRISIKNDGDIWSLYKPDNSVLSVRGDGKYSDDPGETESGKSNWKPIVTL